MTAKQNTKERVGVVVKYVNFWGSINSTFYNLYKDFFFNIKIARQNQQFLLTITVSHASARVSQEHVDSPSISTKRSNGLCI